MKTIISAKTAAETSDSFDIGYSAARVACTLVAAGLSGSEEIGIEIESVPGSYTAVYDRNTEEAYVLKATGNVSVISAPGRYRIVKPATAGSVSVGMHEIVK